MTTGQTLTLNNDWRNTNMHIPQAITDYIALLNGELELVDPDAVKQHKQMIEDLARQSNDTSLSFEERLQARIDYRDLKQENPFVTQERKARDRIEAAFLKAARSKKFAALQARDWEMLGIPKDVASQVKGTEQPGRVTTDDVVKWISSRTGSFTKADIVQALNGGSPNTIKKAIAICRASGMNIEQDNDTYIVVS